MGESASISLESFYGLQHIGGCWDSSTSCLLPSAQLVVRDGVGFEPGGADLFG